MSTTEGELKDKRDVWKWTVDVTVRLCLPLALIAAGVGAGIGYVVPELICAEDITREGYSNRRLAECLFDGNAAKAEQAIIWSIINIFWVVLPHVMAYTIYKHVLARKDLIIVAILIMISLFMTNFTVFATENGINDVTFTALLILLMYLSAIFSQHHRLRNAESKGPILLWITSWTLGYAAVILEMTVLRRSLKADIDVRQHFLVCFILHPVVWSTVLTLLRHSMRLSGITSSLAETQALLAFKICQCVYGWYLIINLRRIFGSVHCLLGCLVAQQISYTATNRSADTFVLNHIYGKRTAEAVVLCSKQEVRLDFANKFTSFLSDIIGLAICGLLFESLSIREKTLTHLSGRTVLTLVVIAAVLVTTFHLLGLFVTHHVYQVDVASIVKTMAKKPLVMAGLCLTIFLGTELSIRLISTQCEFTAAAGSADQTCH